MLTVSQAEEDEEVPPLVAAAQDVKPKEQTEKEETEKECAMREDIKIKVTEDKDDPPPARKDDFRELGDVE